MREIKFRAWNGKGFIGDTDFKWYITPEGRVCWLERYDKDDWGMASTNTWQLMQYTGLKDKNGNEIYEGDIIKDMDGFVATIEYDIPDASFTINEQGYSDGFYNVYPDDLEVIGNIYENKELLK